MPNPFYHPWLHRFAVSTVYVAMITSIAGTLVTSRNAGMAFRDWPTSDGHAMLRYPWLADFARDKDKFLEHGHRLAGVLIGLWSIGLAVFVMCYEKRRWVKIAVCGVLVGVICQGVLGGGRVWFDNRGLAMLHGVFAACVLSLMAVVATSLSRHWQQASVRGTSVQLGAVPMFARLTVIVLALQYLLGGMIRHQGTGLHEHLGLGVLALIVVLANAVIACRSRVRWLQWSGGGLLAIVLLQVMLGGAAWVTKFGFASSGYVAVADSIQQLLFRTAHTVVGIVVVMTAVVHAVRTERIAWGIRSCADAVSRSSFTKQIPAGGDIA